MQAKRWLTCALVGWLGTTAIWLNAQEPIADGQAPAPTFRASVDLVTTDVIPRDSRGQFVADLTREEFEVYEDGVKQDVASVVLIHGGRVFNQLLAQPRSVQEGIVLPPSRPASDAAGRIFAIIVDDLHLQFRDTSRVRQLFTRIKDNLIHEGDLYGVVSTGQSSIQVPLTYDRSRIETIAEKITGGALRPSEVINAVDSSRGPVELRYRAHVAFTVVHELLQNMQRVNNRRKAIIYVSNGYDFNPFAAARNGSLPSGSPFLSRFGPQNPDAATDQDIGNPSGRSDPNQLNDPNVQGQQFADADLSLDLAEVVREANRANATFYTIDPRGLMAGQDLDEEVDPQSWNRHLMQTQTSLRILAEETGGIAVVNTNSFDSALQRMDNETSDYYILGYYSTNPDPTQRDRQIEVRVSRPDLDVWSRTSYSIR